MKNIKKIIILLFVVLMLTACGSSNGNSSSSSNNSNSQTSEPTSNSNEKKEPTLSYEVTDIINDVYEGSYGLGTMFSVVIEVENTGDTALYLKDAVIDYEDDNGHLLQTYNYLSKTPDVIQPGEKGYFYTNGSGTFDDGVDLSNGCNLVPNLTLVEAKGELKRHEVEDTSLSTDSLMGTVSCKGRIVNNTKEEVPMIFATVVYYDANDKVLGISGTTVTNIKPEAKTSFEISGLLMHNTFSVDDVARYVVYADEMYMQF